MHIRAELPWAMAIGNKMVTLSPAPSFSFGSFCLLPSFGKCLRTSNMSED